MGGGGGGGQFSDQGGYDKVHMTRFICHVIYSRIMRANKAKECNYGGWAGFCST